LIFFGILFLGVYLKCIRKVSSGEREPLVINSNETSED